MAFGITPAGFTPMRLQDIKLALETELQSVFGDINLEPTSVFGQFVGVMSKICADWWAGLENVYLSEYPTTAAGVALDNVATLTGITRLAATYTEVTCQTSGTNGVIIPAGSQVANTDGDIFNLRDDTTIPADGIFVANESGPVPAIAGTVDSIITPVSGWDTINNMSDGTLGRSQETDSELRVRRVLSLAITGAGTVEAIRSRIINDVPNVTNCAVFENTADIPDLSGRPPHSIEVVVVSGDPQDIGDMLWQIKPAGIQLYNNPVGGQAVSVIDSSGDVQTIYFTRPTTKYAHVLVEITEYSTEEIFPADGVQQMSDAILAYATPPVLGKDMIIQKWYGPIYSIPGLKTVAIQHAITDNPGDMPSWQMTNLPVLATEIVGLASGRIIIYP
jgi:uncharacterized phage protein gp47/JayE